MEASALGRADQTAVIELGGKSPIIVEPDCDMDGALNSAILGFCMNQGEVCVSTSRLLLADEIYDEFLEKMTARLSRIQNWRLLKGGYADGLLDQRGAPADRTGLCRPGCGTGREDHCGFLAAG